MNGALGGDVGAPDGGQDMCRRANIHRVSPNAKTVFGGEWAAVLLRRGVDSGELIQMASREHHGPSAPCAGAAEGLARST